MSDLVRKTGVDVNGRPYTRMVRPEGMTPGAASVGALPPPSPGVAALEALASRGVSELSRPLRGEEVDAVREALGPGALVLVEGGRLTTLSRLTPAESGRVLTRVLGSGGSRVLTSSESHPIAPPPTLDDDERMMLAHVARSGEDAGEDRDAIAARLDGVGLLAPAETRLAFQVRGGVAEEDSNVAAIVDFLEGSEAADYDTLTDELAAEGYRLRATA